MFPHEKSGAQKRKIQREKEATESIGRQSITKFLKKIEKISQQSAERVEGNKSINDILFSQPSTSSTSNNNCSAGGAVLLQDDENICEAVSETSGKNYIKLQDNIAQFDILNFKDPSTWPDVINDTIRQEIVSCSVKYEEFVELSKTFPKDITGKPFSDFLLSSKSINNREKYPRDWLVWSTSRKTLHCLPCILFEENVSAPFVNRSNLTKRTGFSPFQTPWKKLYNRLPAHENSVEHRNCYCRWKSLQQSLFCKGIDSELQKQIACEADKWKAILRRILDVTLFLSSRGLPFQGDNTIIGDVHNGNFLGTLELLGKYDEIMREHLARVKYHQLQGKTMQGYAHYLSWMSQNEFISLCGEKVLNTILEERKEAIYYGLIVDATPDVSHQEQNVFILRYVSKNKETNKFEIYERFVEFLDFNGKTGNDITTEVLLALEKNGIPLEDCRAQGYDNGANMCGTVKGVKTRILEKNNQALFSPCGAHSLNRVGVNAAKICSEVVTFFGNLESMYVFFSHSPSRWDILKAEVPLSLKKQSETRWSERVEAVLPIAKHYPGVLKALNRVVQEMSTTLQPKVYSSVVGLKKYFSSFEALVMAVFWHKVLSCINERSVIIQAQGISLDVEVNLIKDLKQEMQRLRDSWADILQESRLVAQNMKLPTVFSEKRIRSDQQLTAEDKFKTDVVYRVLDFLLQEFDERFQSANFTCELFSPVLKYNSLTEVELKLKAEALIHKFQSDISPNFYDEIVHLRHISSVVFESKIEVSPLNLLNSICEKHLEPVFMNVCIALRLFCTLPVTVASAERAFSKLGNALKTWQRASMSQQRLNALSIMAIEHNLASTLDFTDVINEFAGRKARKM